MSHFLNHIQRFLNHGRQFCSLDALQLVSEDVDRVLDSGEFISLNLPLKLLYHTVNSRQLHFFDTSAFLRMGDNLFSTSLQLEKAALTDSEIVSVLYHFASLTSTTPFHSPSRFPSPPGSFDPSIVLECPFSPEH